MSTQRRFRVGDRVYLIAPSGPIPKGSYGTIQIVFQTTASLYDVLFDGYPTVQVVSHERLRLAQDWADNEPPASTDT